MTTPPRLLRNPILLAACVAFLSATFGLTITNLHPNVVTMLLLVALIGVAAIGAVASGGLHQLTLMAFTAFAVLLPMTGIRISASLSVADIFLLAGAATLVPTLLQGLNSTREPPFNIYLGGSCCILIGALIGSLFSANAPESFVRLCKLGLAALVFPILVCILVTTYSAIWTLSRAYLVGAVISSCVAIVEPLQSYNQRADGLANHFNTLGLTSVLALGMAIVLMDSARGLRRLASLVSFLILVAGIFLSGSRAALIGCFVAILVALWLLEHRRLALLVLFSTVSSFAVVSSGLLTIVGNGPTARLLNPASSGVQLSNQGRMSLLRESFITTIQDPVFGHGLVDARAAHNLYLQIWQASGVIGVLGIALILYACLILAVRIVRNPLLATQAERVLLAGLAAGIAGFFVADLFQNAFWERYMWLLPSLSVALIRLVTQTEEQLPPVSAINSTPTSRKRTQSNLDRKKCQTQ